MFQIPRMFALIKHSIFCLFPHPRPWKCYLYFYCLRSGLFLEGVGFRGKKSHFVLFSSLALFFLQVEVDMTSRAAAVGCKTIQSLSLKDSSGIFPEWWLKEFVVLLHMHDSAISFRTLQLFFFLAIGVCMQGGVGCVGEEEDGHMHRSWGGKWEAAVLGAELWKTCHYLWGLAYQLSSRLISTIIHFSDLVPRSLPSSYARARD